MFSHRTKSERVKIRIQHHKAQSHRFSRLIGCSSWTICKRGRAALEYEAPGVQLARRSASRARFLGALCANCAVQFALSDSALREAMTGVPLARRTPFSV